MNYLSNISSVILCFGLLSITSCEKSSTVRMPVVNLQEIPGVAVSIAALCESAIDDNGKITINATFDTLATKSFPTVHGKFAVVYRFILKPDEYRKHDIKVLFIDPDGESFGGEFKGQIDASLAADVNPIYSENVIINLQDFRSEKPGMHYIQLWMDGKLINQMHLMVKQV